MLYVWLPELKTSLKLISCILYYTTVEHSKTDTIGEVISVRYKEVSFIQGFLIIFNLTYN